MCQCALALMPHGVSPGPGKRATGRNLDVTFADSFGIGGTGQPFCFFSPLPTVQDKYVNVYVCVFFCTNLCVFV